VQVGQDPKPQKGRAQHILPLRDPGHRLDVDRVQREQSRDPQRAPGTCRQAAQNSEKQRDIERMQPDIRQMKTARIDPVQFGVQHERHPNERLPRRCMRGRNGPAQAGQGQPAPHVCILEHVEIVVKPDELVLLDGHVGGNRSHQQHAQAHARPSPPVPARPPGNPTGNPRSHPCSRSMPHHDPYTATGSRQLKSKGNCSGSLGKSAIPG